MTKQQQAISQALKDTKFKPQKSFNILQKHLDLHELIELTAIISHHLEVESQKLMIESVGLANQSNKKGRIL